MAMTNYTQPIRFFKIILQTNLQRIKIPNSFTRRHGFDLPNPLLINPPDGTKWKIYWKNINGEIWFEKGWKIFTQNYSLQHGCMVIFTYYGTSNFNVLILGQNSLEIDYDDIDNVYDHSDDDSVEILDELPNQRITRQMSHEKIIGEIKKSSNRSLNWPKGARAQEVASKFISSNTFFTILIKTIHLASYRLFIPSLEGIIENKEKNVILQIGKRSWNVKLSCYYKTRAGCHLSGGWSLFASENGLEAGDVCVFELTNKEDFVVFKVHVFKRDSNVSV